MATDKNKPGAKAGSIEEPQPVRAELFSYRLQYTPMPHREGSAKVVAC